MKGTFSIILCCYNSVQRIPKTLQCLSLLDITDIKVEVVLVDNGSKDATAAVADSTWKQYNSPYPLRIVDQPIPGLAAARSKGIEASIHEFLLFCDDDNWLSPDYLHKCRECLNVHPDVAAVGGQCEPVCETPPPAWCNSVWAAYAVGKQGTKSGEAWVLWGAGIVLRRNALLLLEKASFQWILTGRKGAHLSSGEDHELCWALRMAGFRLWYLDDLRLQHFITKDRLTEEYIRRLFHSTAYCVIGLQPYQTLFEREIRNEGDITRSIFWRKAARLLQGLIADSFRLVPAIAFIKGELALKLDLRRRLMMMFILLKYSGHLVENTKTVLALRGRLEQVRQSSSAA